MSCKSLSFMRFFAWISFLCFSFFFFFNLSEGLYEKEKLLFSEDKINDVNSLQKDILFSEINNLKNQNCSDLNLKKENLNLSKIEFKEKEENKVSNKKHFGAPEGISSLDDSKNYYDKSFFQNLLVSAKDFTASPIPDKRFDEFAILAKNDTPFVKKKFSYENPADLQSSESNQDGLKIDFSEKDGILIKDVMGNGVNVQRAHRGFYIGEAFDDGVKVKFAKEDGLSVDSAYDGIDIDKVEDDGVSVFRASGDGVVVYYAGDEGINATGERGNVLRSNNKDFYGLYVYSAGAYPNNPGLYVAGTIYATGTKSSLVETSRGKEPLYAVESPEVEFMCSDTARLVNGMAKVEFNRLFCEAISTEVPLRITLTPKGEWSELFVSGQFSKGFLVKSASEKKDVEFDWIAIGRRKGYEKNLSGVVS